MKPQGRRGEVAAVLHTDFPELFEKRRQLFALAENGSRREIALQEFWEHKGRMVLKFAGIDSISDAETLIGCEIQIPESARAELESGTSYISDLKDCAVVVVEAQGEREIGHVTDVMFGAGEAPLLVVREGGSSEKGGGKEQKGGKEYLIPFAEAYISSTDLPGKRIVMSLPEGMLELDAPLSKDEKHLQQQKHDDD